MLKKTKSRQYRIDPAECLRKHRNVLGILRRNHDVAAVLIIVLNQSRGIEEKKLIKNYFLGLFSRYQKPARSINYNR